MTCDNELKEEWRYVPGYYKYYIASSYGRVKSLDRVIKTKDGFRKRKGVMMNPSPGYNGYLFVSLRKNGTDNKKSTIHSVIALCFLNHVSDGFKMVIDHINNIKTDNRVSNLRIITHRDNVSRGLDRGVSKYVGVFFDKNANKFRSVIRTGNNNRIYLGTFDTEQEAKEYYNDALYNHLNNLPIKIKKPEYSSKYIGVSKLKNGKFKSNIYINKKQTHIGTFKTEEEAVLSILNYKQKL